MKCVAQDVYYEARYNARFIKANTRHIVIVYCIMQLYTILYDFSQTARTKMKSSKWAAINFWSIAEAVEKLPGNRLRHTFNVSWTLHFRLSGLSLYRADHFR